MLSFEEKITELFNSTEVDLCIKKFVPQRFRDDFKQELFLRLLEKKNVVQSANNLKAYVAKTIINMANFPRDIYFKKYVNPEFGKAQEAVLESLPNEMNDLEERIKKEQNEQRYLTRIDSLIYCETNHYYGRLAKAINQHGSFREVSRQTGIPVSSISEAVKKLRKLLQ